jgi:hypothetical protein
MRALVAIAATAALVTAAPAGARNDAGFTDTRNDGMPGDVAGILVNNDDTGILQFKVLIANLPNLPRDVAIYVGFDTDRNPATGADGGADYLFNAREGSYSLLRWDGQRYLDADWRDVIATYRGGLDLWIDWENLGKPSAFDFFFRIERGTSVDRAPDAGSYPFQVIINPQAQVLDAAFTPEPPRAGRMFSAKAKRIQLTTGDWVRAGQATCRAWLAGREIRGRGPGGCTWALPRTAAGKKLVVRLTVPYKGKRIRFVAWDFRVRR